MYGTQRNTPYGYSLWEFQVYGTGGAPNTPPTPPADPANPPQLVFAATSSTARPAPSPTPRSGRADPGTGQNNELQYYTNNDNAQMDGQRPPGDRGPPPGDPRSACPIDPVSGKGTCQYTSAG